MKLRNALQKNLLKYNIFASAIVILLLTGPTQASTSDSYGPFPVSQKICNMTARGFKLDGELPEHSSIFGELLYHCDTAKLLPSVNAEVLSYVPPSEEINRSQPSTEGIEINEFVRWYYIDNKDGIQTVGINIFNSYDSDLGAIALRWMPGNCDQDRSQFSEHIYHLILQNRIPPSEHAVVKWQHPSDARISEGCMDVLMGVTKDAVDERNESKKK